MEKIIELIKYRITPMESEHKDINITRTFHRDDYKSLDAVITSLKFEKMWKKLDSDIESLNPEWRDEIWEMMKNIKGEFLK